MAKETQKAQETQAGKIDPRLLAIMICPLTGGPLSYDKNTNELISKKAGLAYQVREGVPIMLPEEARKLKT